MAISRLTETTLQSGLPKFDTFWDGRSAVGSMEPISAITLSASQSSVEFNNIPGTYSHLQLRGIGRVTASGTSADDLRLQFNNDTGSNYSSHELNGTGSAVVANGTANTTSTGRLAYFPRAGVTASVFGSAIIDILDYANTNKYKTVRCIGGYDANGSGQINFDSANWRNTNAITSIQVLCESNFVQYSSFTLYGIK